MARGDRVAGANGRGHSRQPGPAWGSGRSSPETRVTASGGGARTSARPLRPLGGLTWGADKGGQAVLAAVRVGAGLGPTALHLVHLSSIASGLAPSLRPRAGSRPSAWACQLARHRIASSCPPAMVARSSPDPSAASTVSPSRVLPLALAVPLSITSPSSVSPSASATTRISPFGLRHPGRPELLLASADPWPGSPAGPNRYPDIAESARRCG